MEEGAGPEGGGSCAWPLAGEEVRARPEFQKPTGNFGDPDCKLYKNRGTIQLPGCNSSDLI